MYGLLVSKASKVRQVSKVNPLLYLSTASREGLGEERERKRAREGGRGDGGAKNLHHRTPV
jgi:hypothetical protein